MLSGDKPASTWRLNSTMRSTTYCEAGRILAQHWHLPDDLVQVIQCHHHQVAPAPAHAALVMIVSLADLLCRVRGMDYGYCEALQSRQPASPPLRLDNAEIERETREIRQGGSLLANNTKAGREGVQCEAEASRAAERTGKYVSKPGWPTTKQCAPYRPAYQVDLVADPAWLFLVREFPRLQELDLVRLSDGLDEYVSEAKQLVAAVFRIPPAARGESARQCAQ